MPSKTELLVVPVTLNKTVRIVQWRDSHVGGSGEAVFCMGFQKLYPPITSAVSSQDSTK